jgi:hypothetical protein
VTPLEKASPRGDTGNEPVFSPAVLKRGKTRFLPPEKPQAFGRYQHEGRPQETSGRNFVPKHDFIRYCQ